MIRQSIGIMGLALVLSLSTFAQGVGINATGASPDPSAILDVSSTDKGLLPPRMTQAQRDAISAPAEGLQVYNTDTKCFNFYNGSSWLQSCYDCDFTAPVMGSNSPICEGENLNLTATTLSGATYSWTGPNGFSSSDQNPTITGASVLAGGVYFLSVTYNGCTVDAGNISITIKSAPTVTASSNSPVCPGTTLTLEASPVGGATYSWTGPNGFNAAVQNPSIGSASASNAGTYSVQATLSGCTGPVANTNVAIQNPIPATPGSISGTGGGLGGFTASYSVASVLYATTYTWTVPSGATINSGQGTNSINVTFGSSGGNVCVTADNGCGSSAQQCLPISICSTAWINNNTNFTQNNSTYSSSYLSGYPPINSVDGVTGNGAGRWVSAQYGGMPQWLIFDLGATYLVDQFRLWNLHDDHPNQGVKSFTLQTAGSISGPWTDVLTASAAAQSTSWQTYTLPSAVSSRYWRFYATEVHDNTYGWVQLLEVGWKGCQ